MSRTELLQQLDTEIARLQKARAVLDGGLKTTNSRRGPRHMSAAARSRIAAAQRARWAKLKAKKKAA